MCSSFFKKKLASGSSSRMPCKVARQLDDSRCHLEQKQDKNQLAIQKTPAAQTHSFAINSRACFTLWQ